MGEGEGVCSEIFMNPAQRVLGPTRRKFERSAR